MKKLGFIGMGNMAMALATGFISSGSLAKSAVYAYAPHYDKLAKNAENVGFQPVKTMEELLAACDTFVVACKPYQIEDILKAYGAELDQKTVLSVAAGWNFEQFRSFLPKAHIQCIMPNTPAMVSEGVFLFEETNSLAAEELDTVKALFAGLGVVEVLPTSLMGIGGAISGCGPAFVDLMIEAYADAAVKYGMQRRQAYRIVSKMIEGSATLQLKTEQHPGVLKDQVCSPRGTTIKGVTTLEKCGFRDACISSIDAIMDAKKN